MHASELARQSVGENSLLLPKGGPCSGAALHLRSGVFTSTRKILRVMMIKD